MSNAWRPVESCLLVVFCHGMRVPPYETWIHPPSRKTALPPIACKSL